MPHHHNPISTYKGENGVKNAENGCRGGNMYFYSPAPEQQCECNCILVQPARHSTVVEYLTVLQSPYVDFFILQFKLQ